MDGCADNRRDDAAGVKGIDSGNGTAECYQDVPNGTRSDLGHHQRFCLETPILKHEHEVQRFIAGVKAE